MHSRDHQGRDHHGTSERRFRTDGERGERRGPRGGGHRGGGRGLRGGWQQADLPPADDAADWFAGAPSVTVDREEIVVAGELPAPEGGTESPATAEGRIGRFREDTRDTRVTIALEAEARYGRKVAWGASIGETRVLFTHLAV